MEVILARKVVATDASLADLGATHEGTNGKWTVELADAVSSHNLP